MNFNVRYNKLSHHFFYLQNMSMGRSFCREEYNNAWLEIRGPLTADEEKSIKDFKEIIPDHFMELYGCTFNKNELPQDIKIGEIFSATGNGFDRIWDVIKNDLPRAKINLRKLINENQEIIEKATEQLRYFYNSKAELPETVNVHMILLPESVKRNGGGKFFPENNVVLEGSLSYRFNGIISLHVEVMLHEITHLYFEDYLKSLYEKYKGLIDYHLLKEAVISGLLPYGYLSSKFFGAVVKESFTHYPFVFSARDYIESNKIIDDAFVSRCIELKKAARL